MIAASNGSKAMIEILMKAGSDPLHINKQGFTASRYARSYHPQSGIDIQIEENLPFYQSKQRQSPMEATKPGYSI